jgi:plastocyanin
MRWGLAVSVSVSCAIGAGGLGAVGLARAGEAGGRVDGKVSVVVDGAAREDASGVVVYLTGFSEPPPHGHVPELVQKNRHFEPPLLAITAGQEVSFPNGDPFFHNVFSVSPGQRFDLGQYRTGETKTRLFREPGPVEVYCNIHPEMAATILVLPNRRFATTAADGSFAIDGVPPGTWTLYAYDRMSSAPARIQVTAAAGQTSTVDLTVVQTHRTFTHKNKFGEDYRDPDKYK